MSFFGGGWKGTWGGGEKCPFIEDVLNGYSLKAWQTINF